VAFTSFRIKRINWIVGVLRTPIPSALASVDLLKPRLSVEAMLISGLNRRRVP
jgi:hypothetical protein